MKKSKKALSPLIAVFVLACSVTTPFTSTSKDVVYRSPRNMNLQPQDVPDLQETPVQDPATGPLLPDAQDQDQRAFINATQNIYIESNVIMLSERTNSEPREIAQEVVRKRHPKAELSSKQRRVKGGESNLLITINAFCGTDYTSGLVLVLLRNNVVVVLIGCGNGVTEAYVERLAGIIDGHITAPPTQEEIAMGLTQEAFLAPQPSTVGPRGEVSETTEWAPVVSTDTPVPTPTPSCTRQDLSPEECANAGSHMYNATLVASDSPKCDGWAPGDGSGPISVRFNFQGNQVNHPWEGVMTLVRTGTNIYYDDWSDNQGSDINEGHATVTFSSLGFEIVEYGHYADDMTNFSFTCDVRLTLVK